MSQIGSSSSSLIEVYVGHDTDAPNMPLDPSDLKSDPSPKEEDIGDAIRPGSSGTYDLESVVKDANEIIQDHDSGRRNSIFTITTNGIMKVPDLVNEEATKIRETFQNLNKSPNYDPFKWTSAVLCFVGIGLFISDYVSDITVAYLLSQEENTDWWFSLTVLLITVPLLLTNAFSIFWFHQDHNRHLETLQQGGYCPVRQKFSKAERITIIVFHALLLGPVLRLFYILYVGIKEIQKRKAGEDVPDPAQYAQGPYCLRPPKSCPINKAEMNYYSVRKYYERDSAYLGLVDGFIQDGPQLVLQLYILAVRRHDDFQDTKTAIFQGISVFLSLFSLSWSIVSYVQSSRWADPSKPQMTPLGMTFNFLWRFFIVFSRVYMLSIFATVYQGEFFIFIGLHWLLMALWIFMMGTNFCGTAENRRRPVAEFLYNIVMGFVCIFDYISLKEGPTRIKRLAYYFILFIEAIVLMSLWYIETTKNSAHLDDENYVVWSKESWYLWTSVSGIPSCFVLGITFMTVYYRLYHPEGQMPRKDQRPSLF